MKICAYVLLFILALGGTSFARLDYVYKNGSTWTTLKVSDTLVIKKFAPNTGCNNQDATLLPFQAGTFGLTQDGRLVWITGNATAGFTVTEIAAGPYNDIDTLGPDVVGAVGANGADLFYYSSAQSKFITNGTTQHTSAAGNGNLKLISGGGGAGTAGYGNFFPLVADSANAVLFNWTTLTPNAAGWSNSAAAWLAGAWSVVMPAGTAEVKSIFANAYYLETTFYANGRLIVRDWAGGAIGDYDIPPSQGLKLAIRSSQAGATVIYTVRQNGTDSDFGMWNFQWNTPPAAYVKFVDVTGNIIAGINSVPWNLTSPAPIDVFFLATDEGKVQRIGFDAGLASWVNETVLPAGNYQWLGAAGAADTFFGSYSTPVPVELSDFEIQ